MVLKCPNGIDNGVDLLQGISLKLSQIGGEWVEEGNRNKATRSVERLSFEMF